MANTPVSDAPLYDPDDDLLEMTDYSRTLADFILSIETSYTIGIYGEWGSGKTSFVNFIRHYLDEEVKKATPGRPSTMKFVEFTAWPHRSSDELWRALILTIARSLYDVPDAEPVAAPPPVKGGGFGARLAEFLGKEAVVFREPPVVPDMLSEYRELVSKLDLTPYGTIGKDSGDRLRIDKEEATLAIVKAAVTAAGSVVPFLSGLRGLLGLKDDVDLNKLVHREKNAAVRERINSVGGFQKIFTELFAKKARDNRVCVFVDDLDRCMPDVALELLEAIKIFLGQVPCVFIVAADESLIGQGLKLRYRDLLETGGDGSVQAYFDQKGKEYFEKIIQLRIRVPERTPRQVHTYISAQFPRWMPATDIILAAVGDNPRRLKQYCTWLTFRHAVSLMQE
jgi:hypothetical protein